MRFRPGIRFCWQLPTAHPTRDAPWGCLQSKYADNLMSRGQLAIANSVSSEHFATNVDRRLESGVKMRLPMCAGFAK